MILIINVKKGQSSCDANLAFFVEHIDWLIAIPFKSKPSMRILFKNLNYYQSGLMRVMERFRVNQAYGDTCYRDWFTLYLFLYYIWEDL